MDRRSSEKLLLGKLKWLNYWCSEHHYNCWIDDMTVWIVNRVNLRFVGVSIGEIEGDRVERLVGEIEGYLEG